MSDNETGSGSEWNPRPFIQWLLDGMNQQMWKQVDLARVLNVSPPTVSRWLAPDTARQPRPSMALRLARAFDADPEYVLMLTGNYVPDGAAGELDRLLRLLDQVDLSVDHRARTLIDLLEAWQEHDLRRRPSRSS